MIPKNDTSAPAIILDWDSQFFGKNIGRVTGNKLTPGQAAEVNDWAEVNQVDCLYFLASADDRFTSQVAENEGYHLTDIRLTLVNRLSESVIHHKIVPQIRPAQPTDIDALRIISRNNHGDSRFYYDGHFDPQKCDELYAIWIEKSVRGGADRVLVWDVEMQPVGYVTGKLLPDQTGSIELVGVHPDWQGKGIGYLLTSALLSWFQQQHTSRVTVVTQGRNIGAQVLYQRCGFVTLSTELWYHKWFKRR